MIVEQMKKDWGPVPDQLLLVFVISKTSLIARYVTHYENMLPIKLIQCPITIFIYTY